MWCVKLSDSQRDALRALVREQAKTGPTLTAALVVLPTLVRLTGEEPESPAAEQGIGFDIETPKSGVVSPGSTALSQPNGAGSIREGSSDRR